MAEVSPRSIVRDILTTDIEMPTEEVMAKAKRKGVAKPEAELRRLVIKTRSWMKANPTAKATAPAPPAAARHTTKPKAEPVPQPEVVAAVTPDLDGVFANLTLVNKAVSACGGVEVTSAVAEAVRACGSVDGFFKHLELVAAIRGAESAG